MAEGEGAGGTWGARELFLIIFNGFGPSGFESLWKLSGCRPSIKCPHPEGFPGLWGAEALWVSADPTSQMG